MTGPRLTKPRPRNMLLLAEDDNFGYRILSAAHASGARVHVLARGTAARLARSRLARSVTPATGRFDDATPDAMIAEIDALADRLAIDVVIPGNPLTTRFLIKASDRLTARTLPAPALATFDRLNDKFAFARLLDRLGLPAPPSRLFADGDALARAFVRGELRQPAMIKPLSESGGRGVRRIGADDIGIAAACSYAPVLWQGFVAGVDVSAAAVCRQGEIRGFVAWRRFPGGLTFLEPGELGRQVERIVMDQSLTGVFNFDLRGDADLKQFSWLECNPRVFYSIDLLAAVGLHLIDLALASEGSEADAAKTVFARRAGALAGRHLRTLRGLTGDLVRARPPRALDLRLLRHRLSDPGGYLNVVLDQLRRRSTQRSAQDTAKAPWRWGS